MQGYYLGLFKTSDKKLHEIHDTQLFTLFLYLNRNFLTCRPEGVYKKRFDVQRFRFHDDARTNFVCNSILEPYNTWILYR